MAEIPEDLRAELLSVLGDIRLFGGKPPPVALVKPLMLLSSRLETHDEPLSKQLMVLVLALIPPREGEVVPEGMEKVAQYWIDNSIERLKAAT